MEGKKIKKKPVDTSSEQGSYSKDYWLCHAARILIFHSSSLQNWVILLLLSLEFVSLVEELSPYPWVKTLDTKVQILHFLHPWGFPKELVTEVFVMCRAAGTWEYGKETPSPALPALHEQALPRTLQGARTDILQNCHWDIKRILQTSTIAVAKKTCFFQPYMSAAPASKVYIVRVESCQWKKREQNYQLFQFHAEKKIKLHFF